MTLELREESVSCLAEYAKVPIRFQVDRIYEVTVLDGGLGGVQFRKRSVNPPYTKDYDAIKGEGPTRWAKRWNMSNWGVLSAFAEGRRMGGAVVAFDTDGVNMLEGRRDLAVLWDLRIGPQYRHDGIGSQLFAAAEGWAASRGCRQIKVETQNINYAACRFYAKQGCVLGAIDRFAYAEYPDEVRLLWYKSLGRDGKRD